MYSEGDKMSDVQRPDPVVMIDGDGKVWYSDQDYYALAREMEDVKAKLKDYAESWPVYAELQERANVAEARLAAAIDDNKLKRSILDKTLEENASLRERLVALTAALEPFAKLSKEITRHYEHAACSIRVSDVVKAEAALAA